MEQHHSNADKPIVDHHPTVATLVNDESSFSGAQMTFQPADLFSNKTQILYCYPGGNDTYLIASDRIPRSEYGLCDRFVRDRYPFLEQGGFIERPEDNGTCAHLQMAGGEFCGNAARSLGAVLCADYTGARTLASLANYSAICVDGESLHFSLSVSSAARPLNLHCSRVSEAGRWNVAIEMPSIGTPGWAHEIELNEDERTFRAKQVDLSGITHLVVDEEDLAFDADPLVYSRRLTEFVSQMELRDRPAVGVIWYSKAANEGVRINPVVWVGAVDSVHYESACGSGSLALALALRERGDVRQQLEVHQPSGEKLSCTVDSAGGNSGELSACLAGMVTLRGDFNSHYSATSNEVPAAQSLIQARTLKGFKDRLPSEALSKGRMIAQLRGVFESFGYVPIETPHLEHRDVLVKQGSDEIQKQLYGFTDNGGRPVALRFDLTVPFARFVVQHKEEIGIPFKRYAIGNVFRGENTQAGRYREFTQCDFDFVGVESLGADAEIVEVVIGSLEKLGLNDFTVRLNNRKIMNGFMRHLGCPELTTGALRAIDKLSRDGADTVRGNLEKLGMSKGQAGELLKLSCLKQSGDSASFFESISHLKAYDPLLCRGIEELEEVYDILSGLGITQTRYRIDFSIARGLGYYTGIVYETLLNELPGIGSVCSGGRYDNLTKTFSNTPLPGVGASVGLDRLMAALDTLGLAASVSTPATVLVMQVDERFASDAREYAHKLRKAGVNAELYPEVTTLGTQYAYAERRGHPFTAIIGGQEIDGDYVSIKELHTRTTHQCGRFEDAVKLLLNGKQ